MIGYDLTEKARVKLCNLLQRSLDIFALTPADMTGVPRRIVEHRLNVREGCQPVRQKKRGQAPERNIAINDDKDQKNDGQDDSKEEDPLPEQWTLFSDGSFVLTDAEQSDTNRFRQGRVHHTLKISVLKQLQ
ncbi:hypothetical protein Tco_0015564 [Tanacetum coccineum]